MYYDSRTLPWHQAMREDLYDLVQFSSERPKFCEADVLQFYQHFLALSNPLICAHYLTDIQRDTEFWYGFHPDDCAELCLHLDREFPWWPRDSPFNIEDVFMMARKVFTIKLPWRSRFEAPIAQHNSEPGDLFKPTSTPTPLLMPTPLPSISLPLALATTPHPSPEHPPEIRRPVSAPPIPQRFNDPGEGDLCSQVDLGSLPGTCHGSCAPETIPLSPPSSSVLLLPSCSPALSSPLPVPSPFPQLPARSSSLPCDSLLAPSVTPPLPILATSLLPPSPFVSQPLLVLTPLPLPHSPTHPTLPLRDLSHTPMPSPLWPVLATRSPPLSALDNSLTVPSRLRPVSTRPPPLPPDSLPMQSPSLPLVHAPLGDLHLSPHFLPPPLAFPPSPPPRPPDLMPTSSVKLQPPPPSTPSPSPLRRILATSPPLPPSLLLASPLQCLDGVHSSLHDPPLLLVIPLSPPPQPPDSTPATSAEPQPPPPPVPPAPSASATTEATNAVATHHKEHCSKQPTDVFDPQNQPHPQCRRSHQRLRQCGCQYQYPLAPLRPQGLALAHSCYRQQRRPTILAICRHSQVDQGWSKFDPGAGVRIISLLGS